MSKMRRYQAVIQQAAMYKPATLIEIGAWNGVRAVEFVKAIMKIHPDHKLHYIGYDLFEELTPELRKLERHGKDDPSIIRVKSRLNPLVQHYNGRFSYTLIQGNTNETLKMGTVADFVYIDGGHSIATIKHDYECLKESPAIVFDDYYVPDEQGKLIHDTTLFGCNAIVNDLPKNLVNITILPVFDTIKSGGLIKQVLVTKK